MGGEIEGDRKPLLSGSKVAPIERVGIFRRGEAGILPDRPGLVDIHGWVGAAQVRRDPRPGLEKIDILEIGFAVGRLDRNALGRKPGFCAACRRCGSLARERDISEIRNAAHGLACLRRSTSARIWTISLLICDGYQ